MEVTGKIKAIMPANSGVSQRTGNSWMSQDYVLDYFWWPNQTQPSQMTFRVFGEERIKNFDLHINDEVKITFHIEAHEYDGRWFNEVQCTGCQKIGAIAQQQTQLTSETETTEQQQQGATSAPANNEQADDLPF